MEACEKMYISKLPFQKAPLVGQFAVLVPPIFASGLACLIEEFLNTFRNSYFSFLDNGTKDKKEPTFARITTWKYIQYTNNTDSNITIYSLAKSI
jgi:hypothetical protein